MSIIIQYHRDELFKEITKLCNAVQNTHQSNYASGVGEAKYYAEQVTRRMGLLAKEAIEIAEAA